jgi:hypothetical protein
LPQPIRPMPRASILSTAEDAEGELRGWGFI